MRSSNTCNFNFSHYKSVIKSALNSGYVFSLFEEYGRFNKKDKKICLLRHDIDYVPLWSVDMAELEYKMGIRSTYFFQIDSPVYNVRRKEVCSAIKYIKSLNHAIGLHFDGGLNKGLTLMAYSKRCKNEQRLLSKLIDLPDISKVVSLHCPNQELIGKKIPGMISTYEPKFFTKIKYLSDSQGWYEDCVCKIFKKGTYSHLQLLIHPYLWPYKGGYNFIKDMANIVKLHGLDVVNYMIKFHPVCTRNNKELRYYCKGLRTFIR
ncbi:MAG: hypothetical protein PHG69_03465 [Candidatus Omnitrophica bacterium]|nr:hypothetical protein [Candidatus Omnitrophota bacterium]